MSTYINCTRSNINGILESRLGTIPPSANKIMPLTTTTITVISHVHRLPSHQLSPLHDMLTIRRHLHPHPQVPLPLQKSTTNKQLWRNAVTMHAREMTKQREMMDHGLLLLEKNRLHTLIRSQVMSLISPPTYPLRPPFLIRLLHVTS